MTASDVIATYLPIRDAQERIVAVFEIYSDVTELMVRLRHTQRLVVGSVCGLLALLYALQLILVARAQRTIQEGVAITSADQVFLRVNRAFCDITGYAAEELVGKTPQMVKSGRHDQAFYKEMWDSINRTGSWKGEIWNRRRNGEVYPAWVSIAAVKGIDGKVSNYVGTYADITLRKAAEDEIAHLAFYDHLTDLPNRRLLLDRLRHALATCGRSGQRGALMFLDLDNFKTLNDTQGHDAGDQLLIAVAERLTHCVRHGDTVARLGGDEFVVMLEGLDDSEMAAIQTETIAEKIRSTLSQPYLLNKSWPAEEPSQHTHFCSSSLGVTLFQDESVSAEELMKRADTAMYQAKAAGRNTLRFFDPQMQAAVAARAALDSDLRHAVEAGQLLLYYQPQVNEEGQLTGAEALIRWQHPRDGMVPPATFIPLAEENGLILPIGLWVLETACVQLAAWAGRPETGHLTLAVNVSAHQFRQRDFVDRVLAVIEETGANPRRLKLELTESLLVHDVEEIIEKMQTLKARGVGFSLDDFGTGYSSLSYLLRLPLDQLKIDQSFVRDILGDPGVAAVARTVVALGQSLGLAIIAEGVETAGQRDFLAKIGCLAYQGFFFSRPLPIERFELFAHSRPASVLGRPALPLERS